MADGGSVSQGSSARRLGKPPGSAEGVRRRAQDVFAEMDERAAEKSRPKPDTTELKSDQRPDESSPGDLVKKVDEARGFSITTDADGRKTLRLSGRVDPSVYAQQKLPVPRQELRAYARNTQHWSLLVSSFEASVVQIQALIATKVKEGKITKAEAKEALEIQFAGARADSKLPVLKFLGEHPEYKDLFGLTAGN
jgi:hypothetical protein